MRRVLSLGFVIAATLSTCEPGDPKPPNVIVIVIDDLDQTTSPYWDALPKTRALIADRGVEFTNSFATNAVCCPARATLLTGKYPHNTGVFDTSPPDGGFATFTERDEQSALGPLMQARGYRTAMIGKYLNGYETQPDYVAPGWDDWFALATSYYDGYTYTANDNGTTRNYGSQAQDYQTDVLAGEAVEFIRSSASPFFLYVAPTAPHVGIVPAPRHMSHPWATAELPQHTNFNEADVSDKPIWLRDGRPPLSDVTVNALTRNYRNAMGSLLAVDDMVESIRVELGARLDNTLLVFVSDNGVNLGAHRLVGKIVPYEESLRVPLAIAGPGVRTAVDDRIVIHPDIAATVLDYAEGDPTDMDGRTLRPLLEGTATDWRTDLLVEFHNTNGTSNHTMDDVERNLANLEPGEVMAVPTFRALRTTDRLYVEWYAGARHEYELYDLTVDPFEMQNLTTGPIVDLQVRLEQLAACAGTTCR